MPGTQRSVGLKLAHIMPIALAGRKLDTNG